MDPFRMTVTKEEGIVVENYLQSIGIYPEEHCSVPYIHILYKGGKNYVTLDNIWWYIKYPNNWLITYHEFVVIMRKQKLERLSGK